MISITVVSVVLNIWGRWQTTRITKRVQLAYRKRVFDHAVRLPLHRVYDLKCGGVASSCARTRAASATSCSR